VPLLVPSATNPHRRVHVGAVLDSLDVRAELADDDAVTSAVVVLETSDGRVLLGSSPLSPPDRLGLLAAALLRAEAEMR
jgi:hypothetical protein